MITIIAAINTMITNITRKNPVRPHNFLGILKEYKFRHFTVIENLQSGFNSPTPVKLLRSLKIFNKGLILPPPLNFYIQWRSSIRV